MSATLPAAYKNRKTPGVYITELDAFPKSIVGVQTAVPAFIGYTEQATANGQSLLLNPIAISSMADFEQIFGYEYNQLYDIDLIKPSSPPKPSNPDFSIDTDGFLVVPTNGQPQFNLYYSMRLFYANGGSNCYVVSVGYYESNGSLNKVQRSDLEAGLNAISYQVGPTMLVVPDAVLLPSDGSTSSSDFPGSDIPLSTDFNTFTQKMLEQAWKLQDRVALFDIYGTLSVTQENVDFDLDACVDEFQTAIQQAQVTDPSYGVAYFPFLKTSIVQSSDINYTNFNPNQKPEEGASSPAPNTQLKEILTMFNQQMYLNDSKTQTTVQTAIDKIDQSSPHGSTDVITQNNLLANALPQYGQLLATVAQKAGVLPPSAAMAGLYTFNDQTRGVWNAPANLSVLSTVALSVDLNDAQQGGLNVPINGYAIDVVRNFVGRGPVVWGGRTLNGNSQDWRYIQVRRTIIYIEQSIKIAINQFVFAANVASTWVAVTQMISGFLQNLWSQGGLMGDKASDAFTVLCGMPDTMTATDILNGYMVVQVTLQMVHPAEFIELTFKQQMQSS